MSLLLPHTMRLENHDKRTNNNASLAHKNITFYLDDVAYTATLGDSLASALLANKKYICARSVLYNRPRGIMGHRDNEANAIFTLDCGDYLIPNIPADMIALYDGIRLIGQYNHHHYAMRHVYHGVKDLAAIFRKWYNPASHTSNSWYSIAHQRTNKGAINGPPSNYSYHHKYIVTDILIVGANHEGYQAAQYLAQYSDDIMLIDQNFHATLAHEHSSITFYPYTILVGSLHEDEYILVQQGSKAYQQQTMLHVRAKNLVLATGMHELTMPFSYNDRPRTMLAKSAKYYIKNYGVKAGHRIILYTNNNAIYPDLKYFKHHHIEILAIIDQRDNLPTHYQDYLQQYAAHVDAPIHFNSQVFRSYGKYGVNSVAIGHNNNSYNAKKTERINADSIWMSGGFTPNTHMLDHLDILEHVYNDHNHITHTISHNPAIAVLGKAAGYYTQQEQEDHRHIALDNMVATMQGGTIRNMQALSDKLDWHYNPNLHPISNYCFTDIKHDILHKDMSYKHSIARPTHANNNHVIAPISLGLLAGGTGHNTDHMRQSIFYDMLIAKKAIMHHYHNWLLPRYYASHPDVTADIATQHELHIIQQYAGITDISARGKIMIQGDSALDFLNYICLPNVSLTQKGDISTHYILKSDNSIYSAITLWSLGNNQYMITTNIGQQDDIYNYIETVRHVDTPSFKLAVSSITDMWHGLQITGPKGRDILNHALSITDEHLPQTPEMYGNITYEDSTLLLRHAGQHTYPIYELYIPSHHSLAIMTIIDSYIKNCDYPITYYGTDSLNILRIEQGIMGTSEWRDPYINTHHAMIHNHDNNSSMSYYARRHDGQHMVLVGIISYDKDCPIEAGALLLEPDIEPLKQGSGIGVVSSYGYSPNIQAYIGLGFCLQSYIDTSSSAAACPVIIANPVHNSYHNSYIVPLPFSENPKEIR